MSEDAITATGTYPSNGNACHEVWFVVDEHQFKMLIETCHMEVSRQEYDW